MGIPEVNYTRKTPRFFRVAAGIFLLCTGLVAFFIAFFLGYTAYSNHGWGFAVIVLPLGLVAIGFFIGNLGIRLLKGYGRAGGDVLISNFALGFWGLFFGLASVALLLLASARNDPQMALSSVGGFLIAIGAYRTIRMRNRRDRNRSP